MRGARCAGFPCGVQEGIIPAYAGSTIDMYPYDLADRDHPRVCGEHMEQTGLGTKMMGSSPRMRGALLSGLLVVGAPRIIPAYAGSTCSRDKSRQVRADHPRVCGEHEETNACGHNA